MVRWLSLGILALALSAGAAAPDLVPLPAATIQMGSTEGDEDERPVHRVAVPPFSLDRTEVTVGAFSACVAAGACRTPEATVEWERILPQEKAHFSRACNFGQGGRERHPMNCVSFRQATAFCQWVGKRLPTEEEWERAARGPEGRTYPWGADKPTAKHTNGCGIECMVSLGESASRGPLYPGSDGYATTAPVGSFPAGRSPEGILDLAGNVWEWTSSRYCPYDRKDCDGPERVLRGGSYNVTQVDFLRAVYRFRSPPAYRYDLVGFRCAQNGVSNH